MEMENAIDYEPATPESCWAILRETQKIVRETSMILEKTAKRQEETERHIKEEADRRQKEADRQMKETAKRQEEADRQIKEETDRRQKEADRQIKETAKRREEFDREMKKIEKTLGGWANNQGAFAEDYFFNSFENGKKNFFGEEFDNISNNLKNYWQGIEDEYDLVLYNHTSVALIEVKYKAHENDIPKVLNKANTFRILFPYYKDFKIYLGLASLSFYPELEQECIKQGIAIIKQVGDTVVINDDQLKTF